MFGWLNPLNWFRNAEIETAEEELSAANIALQAAQETIDELVARVNDLSARNSELTDQANELTAENALLQAELSFLRQETDSTSDDEQVEAILVTLDQDITIGLTSELSYRLIDENGINIGDFEDELEDAVQGASTIASVFPNGASIGLDVDSSDRLSSGVYSEVEFEISGLVASALNTGTFEGPELSFRDMDGNYEEVNLSLRIGGTTSSSTTITVSQQAFLSDPEVQAALGNTNAGTQAMATLAVTAATALAI